MPFLIATAPGRADRPNEDFAAVSARCAVLLDGVSGPPDGADGCSHGVARHVRRLGALLLAGMDAGLPPRTALAEAIGAAAALHADTCDLAHRDTPSATVVAVRLHPGGDPSGPDTSGAAVPDGRPGTGAPPAEGMAGPGWLEYLVLSDSVLLIADPRPLPGEGSEPRAPAGEAPDPRPDRGVPEPGPGRGPGPDARSGVVREVNGVGLVADTRLDVLRAELRRRGEAAGAIRALRGVPGGFWTAGSDPRAADEALTGTARLDRFALMTDGATRAVEVFGDLDWGQAFSLVSDKGPGALIERVRALEDADPQGRAHPRGKVRDDATVVSWTPEGLAP
ncbi:hypothetical protein ACOQFV_03570 [Nocardiopsis changdeensis]|uniref:hypothetical protein n=1 Tax=Nocardiopsis TaxID=2013 RepID=UPI0021062C96|nr:MULTISPECIES: hypothetical protein [Nocardiopsis]